MTTMRSTTLPFAAACALLSASALIGTAVPAAAVAIHYTNRAGGDPDAVPARREHATPPTDVSGPHTFDRAGAKGDQR